MTETISMTKQMTNFGINRDISLLTLNAHSMETGQEYLKFRQEWKAVYASIIRLIRTEKSNVLYNQKQYSKTQVGNKLDDIFTHVANYNELRHSQHALAIVRAEAASLHKLLRIVQLRHSQYKLETTVV